MIATISPPILNVFTIQSSHFIANQAFRLTPCCQKTTSQQFFEEGTLNYAVHFVFQKIRVKLLPAVRCANYPSIQVTFSLFTWITPHKGGNKLLVPMKISYKSAAP